MKKTIFTLNIDNYDPIMRELTAPFIKHWAEKIGAELFEINERKFPRLDIDMEKMQIFELGQKMGNDWNIYIDSDALVHPEMIDPTDFIKKDTVLHNGADFAPLRWSYDKYFRRDGRNIGSCNWFTVASDWCIDLWRPLEDITYEEALKNIHPLPVELNTVIKRDHLITDYLLSRNIAKYGLKFTSLLDIMKGFGYDKPEFFHHLFLVSLDEKKNEICDTLFRWYMFSFGMETEEFEKVKAQFIVLPFKEKLEKVRNIIKVWKI